MNKNFSFLIFLGLLSGSFICAVIIGILPPGYEIVAIILAVIGLLFDVIAASARFYSYYFVPFIKRKNNVVTLSHEPPFYVTASGNAIIVKEEDNTYASVFVKIPVYLSSTEMSDEEKLNFARSFSKMITVNSRYPMKLASQLYYLNKDEYIRRISAKLNEIEDKYDKLKADKTTPDKLLERVEGELAMWHNLFDGVNKSSSQNQMAYAMVSAPGANEEEAVAIAMQRAEEVAAGAGSIFGVTASIATGEEMLVFVEPEYSIPPATISELLKKG